MKPLQPIARTLLFLITALTFIISNAAAETPASAGQYYILLSDYPHDITGQNLVKADAKLDKYNSYLRFDKPVFFENNRFLLRVFPSKDQIDTYLESKGIAPEGKSIFILEKEMESAEICFTEDMFDTTEFYRYTFIQYLRSSILNPPLWLTTGFLHFFYFYGYDVLTDKTFIPELKQLIINNPPEFIKEQLDSLFAIRHETELNNLNSKISWALIDYINSPAAPDIYKRFLWDSINILEKKASPRENTRLIKENVLKWIDTDTLADNLKEYLLDKVTLDNLFRRGIDYLEKGEYEKAVQVLKTVSEYNTNAFYYAGLAYYSAGKYMEAGVYYTKALNDGFELPLVLYALGLNLYAKKDYMNAYQYFLEAAETGSRYNIPAREMIEKIRSTGAIDL